MRDYVIDNDLKQSRHESVSFMQYDNGPTITVNVFEDGQAVNLENYTAIAKFKRSDGEEYNRSTSILENKITVPLDSTVTAIPGTLKISFEISNENMQVSTFVIAVKIEEGIGEGQGSTDITVDLSKYYLKSEVDSGKNLVAAAITEKGVSTNGTDSFEIMSTNIRSIETGITPTGIKEIVENGTYDVINYASANVNVPTSIIQNYDSCLNQLTQRGTLKSTIAVMSDIHLFADTTHANNVAFDNALMTAKNLNCDAVLISGDLCNADRVNEFTSFKTAVNGYTLPVYVAGGNHDATSSGTFDADLFRETTGCEEYFEQQINGDIFLFLSQYKWSGANIISSEAQTWLFQKLEEYKNKKRVFLIFHQYITNEDMYAYRDGYTNNSYLQDSTSYAFYTYFKTIAENYKNLIWISGHSHTGFAINTNYPNNIAWNNKGRYCSMVHVPTLQAKQMYILKIYENLVEFVGVNSDDGTEFGTIYVHIHNDNNAIIDSTDMYLRKTSISITTNEPKEIIAQVLPYNASNRVITYSSDNNNVATVDSAGLITPIANGTCNINLSNGNITKTIPITVSGLESSNVSVTGISLNASEIALNTDTTIYQLVATIQPSDATNQNIVWSTSDSTKATVVDGLVTAIANGTVTITATTEDGSYQASCTATISGLGIVNVTGISLNKTSDTKTSEDTDTLIATVNPSNATNQNVVWNSNNTSIATVENGVVTFKSAGEVTITATTEDGNYSASCTYTVTAINHCTGLTLDQSALVLEKGNSIQLNATITPNDCTDTLTWNSNNTSVATVVDGLVTFVGTGTCTITATCGSMTAICGVTCQGTTQELLFVDYASQQVRLMGNVQEGLKTYEINDSISTRFQWNFADGSQEASLDYTKHTLIFNQYNVKEGILDSDGALNGACKLYCTLDRIEHLVDGTTWTPMDIPTDKVYIKVRVGAIKPDGSTSVHYNSDYIDYNSTPTLLIDAGYTDYTNYKTTRINPTIKVSSSSPYYQDGHNQYRIYGLRIWAEFI